DGGGSTIIYQTNEYEKYDHVYNGYIQSASPLFRPKLTLSGLEGSRGMEIVASFSRFQKVSNMSHDLNGLFTYDPSSQSVSIESLTVTSFMQIGSDLSAEAQINAIATVDNTLMMGGNFTNGDNGDEFKDILAVEGDKAESLTDGGLDNQVNALLALDSLLYVGGSFKRTANGGEQLLNAAIYNTKEKKWEGLGAKGLNDAVHYIAEFPVNISSKVESAVAFSGNFTRIIPSSGNNNEISVPGFAVWVPSKKDWLNNIHDANTSAYYGQLTSSIVVNDTVILAGSLHSGGALSPGVVELYTEPEAESRVGVAKFPIDINQSSIDSPSSSKSKRDTDLKSTIPVNGPLAAVFYNGNGKNLTILGGHFSAKDSKNSSVHNLVILDGSKDNEVTGLSSKIDANSTFRSVAVQKDTLFAGGNVTGHLNGTIAGLIAFDLKNNKMSDEQPAALQGSDIVVNAIAPQDGTSDVYVGGHFQGAGSLPCPSVCTYQMDQQSWSRPGAGLDGTANVLRWANKTLIAAGNLNVNGETAYIATYDLKKQEWTAFNPTAKILGPVTSLILAKESGKDFWFSGVKDDGSGEPYVMHYNGTDLTTHLGKLDKRTSITDIRMIGVKRDDEEKQAIMLLGSIDVSNFGAASAVILEPGDGVDVLHPFLLTTDANGNPAKINGFFSENENTFEGSDGKHSRGIVVLVSFCIALGCVFLIVLGGIIASRIRRRQQGYVSAPQMVERKPDLGRVPPAHLLNDLNGTPPPDGPGGTPMI
ncbi:hypothetical protein KEM56_003443, partial [Ascosphaera pollenicola]